VSYPAAIAHNPKMRAEFDRLADDIDYFAEKICNMKLAPKQSQLANSFMENYHTIGVFNRQGGKSTAIKIAAVNRLMFGEDVCIGIYAPTQDQAKGILFRGIADLLDDRLPNGKGGFIYNNYVVHPHGIKKSGEIHMKNGNTLFVVTANESSKSVRGHSPSIIVIDESGDIPDDQYKTGIMPSGATKKGITAQNWDDPDAGIQTVIWETGTPRGRNHFYNIAQRAIDYGTPFPEKEDGTPDDSIPILVTQKWFEFPYRDQRKIDADMEDMTPDEFAQEYEGKWNLDFGFAFPWNQIVAACTRPDFNTARDKWAVRNPRSVYFGGLDLGLNKDHSVFTVLRWDAPGYEMVFQHKWPIRTTNWKEIAMDTIGFLDYWNPEHTLIDRSGVGDGIYGIYFEEFDNVEGFVYATSERKAEIMQNLQRLLAHGKLDMINNRDLKDEFKEVIEDRQSGKPKFTHPKMMHDDRVQSTALAAWAGKLEIEDSGGIDDVSGGRESEYMQAVGPDAVNKWASQRGEDNDATVARSRSSIWMNKDPYGFGSDFPDPGDIL